MISKYKQMSSKERLKLQMLIAACILGVYSLAIFPTSYKAYFESKKMLHRRLDRIEKRTELENLPATGQNPKVIEDKIEKTEQMIRDLAAGFNELDSGFAPVDSSEIRQQLMLEVSTLAQRTGVSLISVSRKGRGIDVVLDRELKRPLLILKANTRFWPLVDFLHGLKDLSFYVSVMNLKLYSYVPEGEGGKELDLKPGDLYALLELSI